MQLYLYLSDALFYESKRELNRDYRTTGSRSNSEYGLCNTIYARQNLLFCEARGMSKQKQVRKKEVPDEQN